MEDKKKFVISSVYGDFNAVNTAHCHKCKKDVKVTRGDNEPYHIDEKTGMKTMMGTFWVKCSECRNEFYYP